MTTSSFQIEIEETRAACPIGEKYGNKCITEGKIPVISCEGSCIRGEIARLAANMIAKHDPYRRGCHGEIITAPHSAMAKWADKAGSIVVIDGCFMQCHGRILKNIVKNDRILQFDALSIYRKYTDLMDVDDVPEHERRETAEHVARVILNTLKNGAGSMRTTDKTACGAQQSCCS